MAKADFWMFHRERLRFSEADPQGMAHNAVYLVWFGIALNEYYRALGYDRWAANARDKTGMHVVRTVLEYKSPVRLDEEVDLAARISRIGRTSVTFLFEIFAVNDGRTVATGEQVWVNTSTVTHRPEAWPADFPEAVAAREPALESA